MQPRKLKLQNSDTIYKSVFDIYPVETLSVSDCQKKLVFYVLGWLKSKLEWEDKDNSNSEFLSHLTDVPVIPKDNKVLAKEVYNSFDLNASNGIGVENELFPHIAYYEKDSKWALELGEIDGRTGVDITFRTSIALYPESDHVVMAIRCTAGYEAGSKSYIPGFRPQFARSILWDDELTVTEHGIDRKFAITRNAMSVNGKSDVECEAFRSGLLANDARKIPVLLISEDEAAEITAAAENDEILDLIEYSSIGFSYVVLIEKSFRKLLVDSYKEYMDHIAQGEVVLHGSSPVYFKREEYPELFKFDKEKNYFDGSFQKVRDLELRKCNIEFDDDIFFRDVYFQDRINKLTGDAATLEDLRMALVQCDRELDETKDALKLAEILRDEDWHECQLEIEDLKEDNKRLETENGKLGRRIESLENAQKNTDSDFYQKKCAELEKKLAELEQKNTGSTFRQFLDRHKAIINLPITNSAKDIIDWIEEYYSDVIIVHEKARKSLADCTWRVDSDSYHTLYYMIHYLAGYTSYINDNETGLKEWEKIEEEYRTILAGVDRSPVGLATEKYKDQYTINVSSYYDEAIRKGLVDEKKRKETATLDMHIKRGVGSKNEEGLVRIYYNYDKDLKKAIIGYMPGHLATITGGR